MDQHERAYANLSKEVYVEPGERANIVHGYRLAEQGNASLNGERCAVYSKREGSGIQCVLVFRGTADWSDVWDDLYLGESIDSSARILCATAWAVEAMLLLIGRHEGLSVTFDVTGHSLGGAVAMGVYVLLFDIPGVKTGIMDLQFKKVFGRGSDQYRTDVFERWQGADELTRKYLKVRGGHLFNPGGVPVDATSSWMRAMVVTSSDVYSSAKGAAAAVAAATTDSAALAACVVGVGVTVGAVGAVGVGAVIGTLGLVRSGLVRMFALFPFDDWVTPCVVPVAACVVGVGVAVATVGDVGVGGAIGILRGVGMLALLFVLLPFVLDRATFRRRARDVVSHHILGDLVSCCFGMGTEKCYKAKSMKGRRLFYSVDAHKSTHSIENFLVNGDG